MLPPVNVVFGFVYVLYPLISLILHALVCWTLIVSPHFKKHVALRMVLFLSLSDALQLVIHVWSGIATVLDTPIDLVFNQVVGFLALTLWNATIFQQTTLAVNRLYVLIRNQYAVPNPRMINFLIGMSWTGALLLQFGYHTQGDRFWYSPEVVNWLEEVDHTTLFMCMRYFKIVCLFLGLSAGIAMLFWVAYQNCTANARHARNRIHSSTEMRLFLQTCISPALGLLNLFIWTSLGTAVEEGGVVAEGLVNFEWILINGIQPYLSLLLARKLRIALAETFGCRSKTSSLKAVNSVLLLSRWSKVRPSNEGM